MRFGSDDKDNEKLVNVEQQNKFQELMEDFNKIEIDDIEKKMSDEEVIQETLLCVHISNIIEKEFLDSLLSDSDDGSGEMIQVVVPIEDVYKSLGYFKFTFENLYNIRLYNPRIKLSLVTPEDEIVISDEMIMLL